MTAEETITTGAGVEFVRIEPGAFRMGATPDEAEEWDVHRDETPAGRVELTGARYVARTPVTNAQFEAFDGSHVERRGLKGFSTGDEEAVIDVSYHDAVAFCEYLTREAEGADDPALAAATDGRRFRLPTEAEWEYAARAGTDTPFWTGEQLPDEHHRAQDHDWQPARVDLTVGETPANPWGLHDVHGLVEEWCRDWYGPYPGAAGTDDPAAARTEPRTDPVGRADGIARVTRGGSHNTALDYLRSANRSAALPADRHWLLGFRPVLGPVAQTDPLPPTPPQPWATDVSQATAAWEPPAGGSGDGDGRGAPLFAGPDPFVREPTAEGEPYFSHNHCPAVTACANGDLLAIWFSTVDEGDREMTILGSRKRAGATAWGPASEFFNVADRNVTGSALYTDPDTGTVYHFNGVEVESHWANLALVMRTSEDHGATWSDPEFVDPNHRFRNQVIDGTLRTESGHLVQPCDATRWGSGGTAIHVSPDDGETWKDPGRGQPRFTVAEGATGGSIAGIHASVVELADGRLMALGRGDEIDGRMTRSVSDDLGDSWTYTKSPLPAVAGGQRIVLERLQSGPLLYVGFTDTKDTRDAGELRGMELVAPDGDVRRCYGMFGAVSYDEGETWPVRRLLAPETDETGDGEWPNDFQEDRSHATFKGYLTATETPDGVVHLLTSSEEYRFDRTWLEAGGAVAPGDLAGTAIERVGRD